MQWLNLHSGTQEQDIGTSTEFLWKYENLNQTVIGVALLKEKS